MNLAVFLSLFSLLLISLAVYVLARKIRLPYTVLLVIAGSLLVPLAQLHGLEFITSFDLTPELLFFVFLPILIFESGYNIRISSMISNARSISLLAVVGLLISTFFIGVSAFYVFKWIGFDVPIIVTLLFGAIISATDPVAVLALFKDYGAPPRLTLIFEGESLFNDGTAFAVFLVLLSFLTDGYAGFSSVLSGIASFTVMLFGGILFGLTMGFLFAKLIEGIRGYEHLEITLTLLVAHFTFILTEVISQNIVVWGQELRFSPIIATLIAAMVIGNYGRFKMSPATEEYMEKFWSYFGFVANSLVFILMGSLFVEQSIDLHIAILPILLVIVVVMAGRALSIYPLLGLLNLTKTEGRIPLSWMHLLTWGSLRGALAVVMVLLIPDELNLPGWNFDFSVKDFLTAITIGCIYFTLLIKATTIGKVMNVLGIDALTDNEQISYYKSKALIHDESIKTLDKLLAEKRISEAQYEATRNIYQHRQKEISNEYQEKFADASELTENLLRLFILGMEKGELREMFRREEISEKIYKKILNMLNIQIERVAEGRPQLRAMDEKFPLDGFEKLAANTRRWLWLASEKKQPQELYVYYRCQLQLLQHVIERLEGMEKTSLIEIFDNAAALQNTLLLYTTLAANTEQKLNEIITDNYRLLSDYNVSAAEKTLEAQQLDTLNVLSENEIITNKLSIMLHKELQQRDDA